MLKREQVDLELIENVAMRMPEEKENYHKAAEILYGEDMANFLKCLGYFELIDKLNEIRKKIHLIEYQIGSDTHD